MSYQPASSGGYRIDVVGATNRAYRRVADNIPLFIELAWLPLAIIWGVAFVAFVMGGGLFGRLLASLLDAAAFLIFGTTFLVRWHRFVLLGERGSGDLFPPGWGDFLIAGIKLTAIIFLAMLLLGLIAALPPHFLTFPLAVIGYFAVAFASVRVLLAFPAAAIARPIPLREAWDRTAGNYWRLLGGVILCYVPFAIVNMIVIRLGLGAFWLIWLILEAIRLVVTFAGLAVAATLLSEAYTSIIRPDDRDIVQHDGGIVHHDDSGTAP